MGDPAGIGPEVVVRALALEDLPNVLVIGDRRVLKATAESLGLPEPADVEDLDNVSLEAASHRAPSAECGQASLDYVERAIQLARRGEVDALVTAPIHKVAIHLAGCPLPGHTEILARRTQTRHPVMMLTGGGLRVALVTIHVAIRKVPMMLTADRISRTLRITDQSLKSLFGIAAPRLAVCGLNPHASDGGRFGREEGRLLAPALARARKKKIDCTDPLPADTLFTHWQDFDAVVAMYHDQGLIPLKMLAFDAAVNVTLGLPIIRTSVDHGTAFDIAGQGRASPNSLRAALHLARELAARKLAAVSPKKRSRPR
jgi:4-hydroxythreonine-4-phosphate dehydrogenase